MPLTTDDPLAGLGLVDPNTGQSADVQTDLGLEWPVATEERARAAEQRYERVDTTPQQGDWESDANPYKQRYDQITQSTPSVGQTLEARKQVLQQQAAQAYELAVKQGVDPKLAEVTIATKLEAEWAKVEASALREATLPFVRKGAAEDTAAKYSDKRAGIIVNADELAGETTIEGMRARAASLAEERRKAMTERRRAEGIDRAEGAPVASGRPRTPDKMSPPMTIKIGLDRGHL